MSIGWVSGFILVGRMAPVSAPELGYFGGNNLTKAQSCKFNHCVLIVNAPCKLYFSLKEFVSDV